MGQIERFLVSAVGSRRTTVVGVLAFLGVLIAQTVNALDEDPATVFSGEAVLLGLGVMVGGIFAKDGDKSSEDAGIKAWLIWLLLPAVCLAGCNYTVVETKDIEGRITKVSKVALMQNTDNMTGVEVIGFGGENAKVDKSEGNSDVQAIMAAIEAGIAVGKAMVLPVPAD